VRADWISKWAARGFVILKTSGVPTYNFACVVDDHDMAISHVIPVMIICRIRLAKFRLRGLGLEPPEFAHFGMILGSDGSAYRKAAWSHVRNGIPRSGYLPDVHPELSGPSRLGTEDSQQIFTQDEMKEKFSLEAAGKARRRSTYELLWMNGEYIRKTTA